MLNPNGDSIYSAGLTEFADLIYDIVVTKASLGKNISKFWDKAYKALIILDALEDVDYYEEEDANPLYSCLSEILEITNSSDYPTPTQPPTIILAQGPQGDQGPAGEKGDTGGGTDFNAGTISTTTVADSFGVGEAYAARWDYIVNGTAQRTGTIRATWIENGSIIEYEEQSTADINGSTADVTFTVTLSGTDIRLNAVIAAGTWAISGTRYWIPGNGNYTAPTASTLSDGTLWIGNSSNLPVERMFTGVLAITNTGVTSFNPGSIVNVDISNSANISVSKLAALTVNKVVVTNAATGKLETADPSISEINFVAGVTSALQTQLNGKQATVTGAASTVVSANLSASVAVATDAGGKIVDGGITVTEQNSLSGISGNVQTLLNAKQNTITGAASTVTISNLTPDRVLVSNAAGKIAASSVSSLGVTLSQVVVEIGDWDMDATQTVSVTHGIADYKKIRGVQAIIRDDADTQYERLDGITVPGGSVAGAITNIGSTTIDLHRVTGQQFDSTGWDSTSFNRGWILITYDA